MDPRISNALRNPKQARIELDRLDCAESFLAFVKLAWHILEPNRKFVDGWAVKAICDALQAVSEGKIKRLLINVPPGCTKSMTTSVLWPAWEWGPGKMPAHRFINGSYEKGLSTRDLVRCRDLITSDWYQERWPTSLKEDSNNKTYYENGSTGWRLATSVGGALTGYRGDRIVIDDPHDIKRAESEAQRDEAIRWWTETLPTRFNDQEESALVLMMQRLHVGDLSGHVLKTESDVYAKLILPMEYEPERHCTIPEIGFSDPRKERGDLLWPERFSRPAVERMKRTLASKAGSYAIAGQLQQRPVSREGGMFPAKHVQRVGAAPDHGGMRYVRGWDLAATDAAGAAYTVGVLLGITPRGQLFVMDVNRFRGGPHEVERRILETAKKDGLSVPISIPQDPAQAGKHQKSAFAALLGGFNVHFSLESGDKKDRAIPLAAQWEAGNMFILDRDWTDDYLAEVVTFPGSDYLDQVDATTRAYAYLLSHAPTDDIGTDPGICVEYDSLDDDSY